jgi:hypothetical protein
MDVDERVKGKAEYRNGSAPRRRFLVKNARFPVIA